MFQFQLILEQIRTLDFTPLMLAVTLGGLIGLEREWHGRPAGLRTHILVCVASTSLILVSRFLQESAVSEPGAARLVIDPTRLAAGIVTGIGFLGAASVIKSGDIVRGITTGACIWAVSALGVVIGNEAYGLAVVSTGIILFALVLLDRAESWIRPVVYRKLVIRCDSSKPTEVAGRVRAILKRYRIRTQDLHGGLGRGDESCELVFHIRCRNSIQAPMVLEELAAQEGVEHVLWA